MVVFVLKEKYILVIWLINLPKDNDTCGKKVTESLLTWPRMWTLDRDEFWKRSHILFSCGHVQEGFQNR